MGKFFNQMKEERDDIVGINLNTGLMLMEDVKGFGFKIRFKHLRNKKRGCKQ